MTYQEQAAHFRNEVLSQEERTLLNNLDPKLLGSLRRKPDYTYDGIDWSIPWSSLHSGSWRARFTKNQLALLRETGLVEDIATEVTYGQSKLDHQFTPQGVLVVQAVRHDVLFRSSNFYDEPVGDETGRALSPATIIRQHDVTRLLALICERGWYTDGGFMVKLDDGTKQIMLDTIAKTPSLTAEGKSPNIDGVLQGSETYTLAKKVGYRLSIRDFELDITLFQGESKAITAVSSDYVATVCRLVGMDIEFRQKPSGNDTNVPTYPILAFRGSEPVAAIMPVRWNVRPIEVVDHKTGDVAAVEVVS